MCALIELIKMKKLLLLRSLGLLVGIGIVSVSLLMARTVNSNGDESSSHKQLHLGDTVLPDHTLYPFLMAVDRSRLLAASRVDRLPLLVSYGQRRLDLACRLVEEDKPELATTTLLKAHHYLLQAADEVITTHQPAQAQTVLSQLSELHETCIEFKTDVDLIDKSAFEEIMSQNLSAQGRLEQLLITEH